MSRANLPRGGFQFWGPKFGSTGSITPQICKVASTAPATYDLYRGDPVEFINGGTVTIVGGAGPIFGVCADIIQFKDPVSGILRRNGKYVPAGCSYTADSERTLIAVWPADSCLFVVDSSTAAATLAAARAFVGYNVDGVSTATAATFAVQALGLSGAHIDTTASTPATTNTLSWRIVDVLDQVGNDPTQTYCRYIVEANLFDNRAGLPSTTGV